MAGYDPKAKRAHSPAAPDDHAPVDDLLGAPASTPVTTDPRPVADDPTPAREPAAAPRTAAASSSLRPETRPLAPTPAAATGADPKVLAALVAAVVALLLFWRHRRRG